MFVGTGRATKDRHSCVWTKRRSRNEAKHSASSVYCSFPSETVFIIYVVRTDILNSVHMKYRSQFPLSILTQIPYVIADTLPNFCRQTSRQVDKFCRLVDIRRQNSGFRSYLVTRK